MWVVCLPRFTSRMLISVRDLSIAASDNGITAVSLDRPSKKEPDSTKYFPQCQKELEEYFSGKRTRFTIPLDLTGTPFQKKVWSALRSVPYGSTMTYGQLAKKIGKPRAVRAVASAVAKNPVGIIIPCHRIVPASGAQPGKYAWGVSKKKWLLGHEKKSSSYARFSKASYSE